MIEAATFGKKLIALTFIFCINLQGFRQVLKDKSMLPLQEGLALN